MIGPCFCKPGIMSQCIATDYDEQVTCRFFVKSANGPRCMHKNDRLYDHCWSQEAQALGLATAEFVDDDEELELDLDKLLDNSNLFIEKPTSKPTCSHCVNYSSCSVIISATKSAAVGGGLLTHDVMEQLAAMCASYKYDGGVV